MRVNCAVFACAPALLSLTLALSSCASKDKAPAPTAIDAKALPGTTSALPVITGGWKSSEAESIGNGRYSQREYTFNLNRWELIHTIAVDRDMKKVLLISRAQGGYTIEAASSKIPGGFNAILRLSRRSLILKSKDKAFQRDMGFESCGLKLGQENDITAKGCSIFRPNNECSQEFQVLKLDSSELRLGEIPVDNDLCTSDKRPEHLGPPLKKIN